MSTALPILTYHSLDSSGSVLSVDPEGFKSQMNCLSEMGYRGVCLRDAVRKRRARGQWPERTVAITFDDGYENVYRHGAPVLARHGFAATIFLVTGHMGGTNDWAPPPPKLGVQPLMDWETVKSLVSDGWEVGAHTRTHPDLRRLTLEQMENEVARSRVDIQEQVQQKVESFAYPFGFKSPAAARVVAREFQLACVTDLRRASGEALHALPRVDAYYLTSLESVRRLVDGRLDAYLALRRWGRWVRAALMG